jgi:hypothetical protein
MPLGSFLVFSWACYSIREIKPEMLAAAKPGEYKIQKIEKTTGETIEYPNESLGQVGEGQITGTGKLLYAAEAVEVDSAGLEIISPPGLSPMNIRTRDGKTYGWVKRIEERGDKSVLYFLNMSRRNESTSRPVLISDIQKAWTLKRNQVVLGFYGGGTLSSPVRSPTREFGELLWQDASTWKAGRHLGYFIQFYSPAGHLSYRLEFLSLKYQETDAWKESFSDGYTYFGVSLDYSFFGKATQRMIPFIGVGLMGHFYLMWGGIPVFPPQLDFKADLGLKFKIDHSLDLNTQLLYMPGSKLLAWSLGIDLIF